MKIRRIMTAVSMCVVFVCGNSVFADFPDMPEDGTKEALTAAVENGLLTGYDNGEIRPYNNITRAEMGAILVRAMGAVDTEDISMFSDMKSDAWYYESMSKAVAMGAFKGDGTNLNPEVNITFQEAFVVLSRIFELANKGDAIGDPFAGYYDADLVADWAKKDVGLMLYYGYWAPETGYLRPTEYINRAEFATVMHSIVGTYIDEVSESYEFAEGNVVVRAAGLTIQNYNQEKNDIYLSDGVSGKVTFKDSTFDRIVARGGDVDFLTGACRIIRMIPGKKLNCYISADAKVNVFDGPDSRVSFDPIQVGK